MFAGEHAYRVVIPADTAHGTVVDDNLAVERVLLAVVSHSTEYAPYVYAVRLIAYLFIIVAIVDKNRPRKPA